MIEEFIYYWKQYDLRTAWDVLLHGDLFYELLEDTELSWYDSLNYDPETDTITFRIV